MRRLAPTLLLLVLVACSPGGSPGPDAGKLLRDSGTAMASVQTVTADVTFGQGLLFQGFTLVSATSKLKLPADSDSTFKVKQNDFLVDVRVVSVGGSVYLKVPFTPFTLVPPAQASALPDPARLLDPVAGLPGLMGKGRKPSVASATEQVDGVDCDRVSALYTAADVGAALGGSVKPAGDISASFWIARKDHLVRRASLAGQLVEPGKSTTVEVRLHDYNAPLEIAKPAL